MKVFVVKWHENVIGVYSTLEKARSLGMVASRAELWDDVKVEIIEYQLDIESEVYHEMESA